MDNDNQLILQRYELISACIDKTFKSYTIYKSIYKELFKNEDKHSNENIETFCQPFDDILNSSLLLDDYFDDTKIRQGKPTAHRLYGANAVTNYCMYSQMLTLKKLANLFPPSQKSQVLQMFIKAMIINHNGQGMDIYWRDTVQCPTEEQYMEMVKAKSCYWFDTMGDILSLYQGCPNRYSKLFLLFGMYGQLRNDYVNLKSQKYAKSKGFCEDITEGKFSLPVIHAITSKPEDTSLFNILKQRTESVELKKHLLDCFEKFGSLKYTWNLILDLNAQLQEEIAHLGGLPYFEELIEATLDIDKPFY